MKAGSLVKFKVCGRIGKVIKVKDDLIEVRLLSGSRIIAHKSFFSGSKKGTQ